MVSCVSRYSFTDPSAFYVRSYYAPFLCDWCSYSGYNITSCPIYECYAQPNSSFLLAQCTGFMVGESFGSIAKA